MGLGGQGSRWRCERGYAMAALLVMLAVMAVLMSVAMPVWRQQARREKEAELIFRGEQYARAVALYNFKMQQQGRGGTTFPPSIDVLVEGRYLRKKYKDPMTKDGEFVVIPATGPAQPGFQQPGQQQPGQSQPQTGFKPIPMNQGAQRGGTAPGAPPLAIGGVMGVRSKSEENSLRSYRGATRYDQWLFISNNVRRPGGQAPQGPTPGNQGPGAGPRGNNPNSTPGNPGRGFTPMPFPGSGGPGSRPLQPPGGPGRGGRGPGL